MDHNAFFFSIVSAWAVAGIFALSAVVQLFGPGFVRRAYARWELPRRFYLVTALVELIAAALLIDPSTRIWGIALAGLVNFFAVVTLLNNRQ